jgi:hypothetical protein
MADIEQAGYQPHWEDDANWGPSSWDTVFIDDWPLPGRAKVRFRLSRAVEKKKAKGKCGGTITDNGEEITEIEIELEVATPEEWVLWQDTLPKLWTRKKGGKRSPKKIDHPKTAVAGITEVYIESIDMGDPDNGVMKIRISCSEWLIAPKDAPKPQAQPAQPRNAEVRAYSPMFNYPHTEQPSNADDIIAGTAQPGSATPW